MPKGKKYYVANVPAVFDIEATSFYNEDNEKCGLMYAWVFGINGRCIRGRTWDEFLEVLNTVITHYHVCLSQRFVIYVHNLSYEFQFFKHLFEWDTVFSLEQRKPIYALTAQGIEFRCSYLLSGYSLEKLGENLMKYKVEKKVGDLDYNLIRHSKTPLTDKEWGYILNDGLVVMAYIQEEIERLGDITKIPLTKTGYVRQLIRDECLSEENKYNYRKIIKRLRLSKDEYLQLKRAFTGGFTHANVNYVGRILENVSSYDFTSSYPAVMLSEKYPMSSCVEYTPKDGKDFIAMLKNFCCLFDVEFINIDASVDYENYISKSRCTKIEHYYANNGRVISATYLAITLTEQDFFIIQKMYTWDEMYISNFRFYRKDYLPKEFLMAILELYQKKTTLKGVDGKEVEYMVSKNMLNSCYGMCVTDICRDETMYEERKGWFSEKPNIDEVLDDYNKSVTRTLFYPWGVWVTAYARRNLFTGIEEFKNDYIYSDTDSLKVLNIDKHKEYIERYNKQIGVKVANCLKARHINVELATPKTKDGVEKPIGVWDYEGQYTRFKTLGAKRYVTEKDGKCSITVAGVSKKAGMKYLEWKYKTNTEIFNNFEENLEFPSTYYTDSGEENGSGKLLHTYIDIPRSGELVDYLGNVAEYKEQSATHLENTSYNLSLEKAFINLILGIKGSELL